MIDSTQILHFILKFCIDDPKLHLLSFSMKDSDYEKFQSLNDPKQFSEEKELILKILETLWLVPEHIDFNEVGYANDSVFEECIAFFINGDFINEENVVFHMIDKRHYISNILVTFYEQFPVEGRDIYDSKQTDFFKEYINRLTLHDIKEFWSVFIQLQIVYFKYKKNDLGFDQWSNFGLPVYNDLCTIEMKRPIFDKVNIVLSHILNPKEFM
jgi:hypothetical protein